MNKIFRVIWNATTQSWVAVSELSRVKTKSASSVDKRPALVNLSKIAVVTGAVLGGGLAVAALQQEHMVDNPNKLSIGYVDNAAGKGIAIGINASTAQHATNAIAIGYDVHAGFNTDGNGKGGRYSVVIGYNSSALGWNSTALGSNAHANGQDAFAAGVGSNATGISDLAIGKDSKTAGQFNIAIGAGANAASAKEFSASNRFSVAVGFESTAVGSEAIAIGKQSKAVGIAAIAIGRWTDATGQDNIAIGDSAKATGSQSTAIGWEAKAQGNNDIAMGYKAETTTLGSRNTIFGESTKAKGTYGIALGAYAITGTETSKYPGIGLDKEDGKVLSSSTVAIGRASRALEARAVALGREAYADDLASTAVGYKARSTAAYANVFGSESNVSGNGTTAVGNFITDVTGVDSQVFGSNVTGISANNATVIGSNINTVTLDGGVVLGNASTENARVKAENAVVQTNVQGQTFSYSNANWAGNADTLPEGNYVSVGAEGNERQLKNVAAGQITATSTDAINGSQLFAALTEMPRSVVRVGTANGGSVTPTLNATTGYYDYVVNFPTLDQQVLGAQKWYLNVTNGTEAVNSFKRALPGQAYRAGVSTNTGKVSIDVNDGEEAQFIPLDNMEIYQSNNRTAFRVSMNPSFNTSSLSDGTNGVNFSVSPTGGLSLTDGSGNNPVVITGVANGTINPTSVEAVNGSQLYWVMGNLTQKGLNFVGNDGKVKAIPKKLGETLAVVGGVAVANKASTSDINTYVDNNGTALIVKIKTHPEFEGVTLNTSGNIVNLTTTADGLTVGKKDGSPAKIQNVAKGTEPNDAVNVAQLPEVVSGKNVTVTPNTDAATGKTTYTINADVPNSTWTLTANADDATKTTVDEANNNVDFRSSDSTITINKNGNNLDFVVNTSPLSPATGPSTNNPTATANNPNGAINVPTGDDAKKLVNASTVATAINSAFWTLNSTNFGGGEGTYTQNTDSQISAGDIVNINAAKNIKIEGQGNTLNVSTVENPTFTNVTAANMSVGAGNNPIQIGDNAITGLNPTLPATTSATKNQSYTPATIDPNKAATVGDVLNAGWNLQENGTAKDFVKPYETVNFVNGKGTNVNVTSDGSVSTIRVDIATTEVTTNLNPLTPAGGNTPDAGKVNVIDGSSYVTGDVLKEAVNNSGWKVTSDIVAGKGDRAGAAPTIQLVQPGETVKFIAGQNLVIEQAGQDFTYSTVMNPTFTNTTVGGNDKNGNTPITMGTDEAGNNVISNLTSTLPKTNTENLTKVGDVNVGNTTSNGKDTPFTTNVERPVLNDPKQENNAATLGDVLNAGWNLQENGTAKDFVKPYDTVNFVNGTGTSVNITSDGNVSKVRVDIAKSDVVTNTDTNVAGNTETNTPDAGKVVVTNGTGSNFVTGDTLAKAVNNSGWKVTSDITGTGERAGKAATTELVQPGEEVKFIAGDNLQITQDGQNFTYATKKDVTFSTVNVTEKLNVGNITATPEGIDMADNRITNLAPGVNATDAVNVAQLPKVQAGKNITITEATDPNTGSTTYTINSDGSGSANPWKLTTNGDNTNASTVGAGDDQVDLSNQDGNINITKQGNNVSFNLNPNTVLGGKDGVNGKDGKDGSLVVKDATGAERVGLNGKDGSIGINGKDGANATLTVADRQTTIDPKDADNNITRIIYNATRPVVDANGNPVKDANGNPVTETVERQVATMDDGLVFAGDAGDNVPRKLGQKLKVTGGETNRSNVSENPNVGIFTNPETGELQVRLAKKIDLGDNSKVQTGDVSISSDGINAGGKKVTNVADGELSPNSKDAVNGSQLYATNQNVTKVQNEVAKGWNITTSKSGTGNVEGTTLENVKMGNTVTVDAGNNINITQSGRKVSIATSMHPTFNTVTATESVTIGQGGNAVNLSNDKAGNLVINQGGKPAQIKNVAAGTDDTDAVNVSQLKGAIGNVNNNINQLGKRVRGIGASAAAAASLPQVYIPGKSMVAAAAGGYGGKSAIAVGYSRASDNGKLILKLQGTANSAGHYSGGVGVGYQW